MLLARVDGSMISTVCHPSLHGWRHLLCQPLNDEGEEQGPPIAAIDCHGAGIHQRVVVTSDGRAARELIGDNHSPVRYFVIAVVDEKEKEGRS